MILAIESSCDESALALFDPKAGLKGEWVHSQVELHTEYGGVVPDLASREHLKNFFPLMDVAGIRDMGDEIDRIVVTHGPGLAGCLALGIAFAKAIGLAWNKPVGGVNHLRGHAFSPFIAMHEEDPAAFGENLSLRLPHLGLIVSGGNTILFEITTGRTLKILAETVDDAAGEALDKGAKLLGLPYPGGPEIERLAKSGSPKAFNFPKAIAPRNQHRFSFSGLKTSLRYKLEAMDDSSVRDGMPDLCAAYQAAVVGQLSAKTRHVLDAGQFRSIGLSGGVAKNRALRSEFERLAKKHSVPCYIAAPQHTGDNAAMIAFAAFADPAGVRNADLTIEPSLRLA